MQDNELEKSLAQLLRIGDLAVPIAIRTANELGLVDLIGNDEVTNDELADELSVDAPSLNRLLFALTAAGILSMSASKTFRLTEMGLVLQSEHPLSMRYAFGLAQTEIRAWAQLAFALRSGKPAFECAYGESHRSYRSRHDEEDVRMDRIHCAATRLESISLLRAYPWSEAETIVDVGSGTGAFIASLLSRFPHLHGTLFDLPRMVRNAPAVIEKYGVAERCRLVGGDFFSFVPEGADLYVLKAVVGGWDNESCIRIFTVIHDAMRADSRLLVIEPIMGSGDRFAHSNALQLHSLVLYGGPFRNLDEYRNLADQAGFSIQQVIPRSTLPILELVPVEFCSR